MDYTSQPFLFKLKKAWRYVRLYGPTRTLVKIRGQYHMRRTYERMPAVREDSRPTGAHVGLIGCGNFAFSVVAYYLRRRYGRVIRASMDHNPARAASLYEAYGLDYYTGDAEKLLRDPEIDLVYVASNHASHAEYAIRALEEGKSVHVEKPHVVSFDQLGRLCRAMSASGRGVRLGFNRPGSRLGEEIRRRLAAEEGPSMLNWFIAGHEISPDHWYFKPEEGGRVLGNLCHWTDFVYHLVPPEGRYPLTIRPTRAAKSDCDIAVTYTFADGSIAAITFSAKGHTFEGVRERFAAHRGNTLISLDDFKRLVVEVVDSRTVIDLPRRDHGHERAICASYEMVRPRPDPSRGASVSYVWETGELFLRTREALETGTAVVVRGFDETRLAEGPPSSRQPAAAAH